MTRTRSVHSPPGNAAVNATMSATGSNAAATAAEKRAQAAATKWQQRQADPKLRAREAEARRKHCLQESTEATRAHAAKVQHQRRQAKIEATWQHEPEAKRKRRAADPEAVQQRKSVAKAAKRLMLHMVSRYTLRCISYDHKHPTTIRRTCTDLVFSNFKLQPLQQDQQDNPSLTLHITDHKAVILKRKRNSNLKSSQVMMSK